MIDTYKNTSDVGLTQPEMSKLLEDNPDISAEHFWDALNGSTGIIDKGELITYTSDIELAIRCGRDRRKSRVWEWD